MSFQVVSSLAAFFFCGFFAFMVLRYHYRSGLHRIFSLFLLAMGLWAFSIFGVQASPDLEEAFMWEKAALSFVPVASVLFYHFVLLFTQVKPPKGLLPAAYALALLFVPLSALGLLAEGMEPRFYGYVPVARPLFYLWVLYTYLLLILASYALVQARRYFSPEERNRIAYILAGIGCYAVGGVTDLLGVLGLPSYSIAMATNIAFCLLATIAVVRYRLLDIRIALARGVTYSIVSALVLALYVGFILMITQFFYTEGTSLAVAFVFALVLAVWFWPAAENLRKLVDRWFYRERYDHLKSLEEFSQESRDIIDIDRLSSSLIEVLKGAMQTDAAHLMLPSQSTGDFTVALSSGPQDLPELALQADSPLISSFRQNNGLVSGSQLDVFQALTEEERSLLEQMKGELFIPLKAKDKLTGILILGPKLSGKAYDDEDMRVLRVAANQAAISIENARLYALERERVAELQKLGKMKSDFLSAASHQLKTPITSIKASMGMLRELAEEAPTSVHSRLISSVDRGVEALEKEVTQLSDLAKLQTATLELHREPIDTKLLITEVVKLVVPLVGNKSQILELELPDSMPTALVDRHRFEQVLVNLLTNANQFTPDNGRITVSARQDNASLVVAVRDNGPGIPIDEQRWIFEPYYQIRGPGRQSGGSGLGLAIAKSLVELQGGKIWVESSLGEGSTFLFSLPLGIENEGSSD